ncbi:hypothetical protein PGTUg99_002881 [Puccinia graminis f. sp. tritici]|uniref:Uncharacterized protein n=1 Tax=Puccinia graminis f. sp. tritici TaxID=56615 RepID=A0A5B0MKF1_PUCGR|nr:hypothetical protein PGTUg99_002881 [Puccinia graminis f. sp. tritici]
MPSSSNHKPNDQTAAARPVIMKITKHSEMVVLPVGRSEIQLCPPRNVFLRAGLLQQPSSPSP